MKRFNLAMLIAVTALAFMMSSMPGSAQSPPSPEASAKYKFTREEALATLTKVSQDVWRAKYAGAGAQHMQSLFLDGQRAYFGGDYDAAMRDFRAAEEIYKKYPNAISAD